MKGGITVTYEDQSPLLEIVSPMGTNIVGEVCVKVRDINGRECRHASTESPGKSGLAATRSAPSLARSTTFFAIDSSAVGWRQ